MAGTRIKSTKKFRALVVALNGDEKAAMVAYRAAEGLEPEVDPRIQELMGAGFSEEQARKALAVQAEQVAEATAPAPLTSKERGEALVAKRGLTFTKGRVYVTGSHAEAIVRVLKTGKPEIVESSGVGRTKAVLVYREDSGDVALQNLTEPA